VEDITAVAPHRRTPLLANLGTVAAAPFHWIERGVSWALTQPVKPLWRTLDAHAAAFERSPLRKVIALTLFPAMLIGSVALGFAVIDRGLTLNTLAFTMIYFMALGLIMAPLERLMPWSRNWLHRQDSGTDLLLMLSIGPWLLALTPLSVFLTAWLVDWIHGQLPPETIKSFWPTTLPAVLQVLLLLVVMDFFRYWYHRWMHETAFMWRWHSVHHSSTRLYWFNGVRSHPIETFVSNLIWVVPFTLIQAPTDIVFVAGMLARTIGRFQHTNIDVKLGPLEYVFSGPDNHRYHHSKDSAKGNKNYGGDVILWDHVFGTFYLPQGEKPSDDIGVGGMPDYPQTWLGLMLAPFSRGLWGKSSAAQAAAQQAETAA
jgi:ornithine lipid hydroxylase